MEKLITSKSELKRVIELETHKYDKKWFFDLPIRLSEQQQLYKFVIRLRKAEYAINCRKWYRRISLFRLNRFQMKYSLCVPINVINEGFWLNHLGSLIINANATIGKNVRFNPGVCIGENKGKAPVIGDNVYFGPGAKVFGDVVLANGVQVGANAVVTKSCLIENSRLVGVPAEEK